MLCKKCKTSVADGERTCPFCGARVSNGRKSAQIMLSMLALLVIAGSLYLYFSMTEQPPEDVYEEEDSVAVGVIETPHPTPTPQNSVAEGGAATPEPVPEKPAEFAVLMDAASATERFISESAGDFLFVSYKGYLYNETLKEFVTISDITGYFGMEDFADDILLLYVMPHDFSGIREAELSGGGRGLTVYAAQEAGGAVLISDSNNLYGTVYRDSLNSVLALYATSGGEKRRPASDDPIYSELLELASAYTYSAFGYTARYICTDDKYAAAVFAERGGDEALTPRGFIFERFDGGWKVALSELEEMENIVTGVNAALPDMDLGLLPAYSIYGIELMDEQHLSAPLQWLMDEGADGDNAAFVSGVKDRVYIVLSNGAAYIMSITNENGAWLSIPVSGWAEAETLLGEHAVIILQD